MAEYVNPWDADAVIANFTFSIPTGDVGRPGQTIVFIDTSENVAQNIPCKFEWDWGDGSTWGNTQNATHMYNRAGGFSVTHWVTGSKNLSRSMQTIVVYIGGEIPTTKLCDPAAGNPEGIISTNAPYSEKWTGTFPFLTCTHPYTCLCAPSYTKYTCNGGGTSQTKIRDYHEDCCAFCSGTPTLSSGTIIPITLRPVFRVVDVVITPQTPGKTERITAVAHVSNIGNAAGAATVALFWETGVPFSSVITTETIGVNTTVAAPPAYGFAPSEGIHKLCAQLR